MRAIYSEDHFVQETTAKYFRDQPGYKAVYTGNNYDDENIGGICTVFRTNGFRNHLREIVYNRIHKHTKLDFLI